VSPHPDFRLTGATTKNLYVREKLAYVFFYGANIGANIPEMQIKKPEK
jgi:hypothetical protein